ncbi:formyltetrahydrofolate deformylase [Halotalea alkalilenta]|uniref:Formyltetrahydrofolate deformylase n=1 Tax=Halotalea alkalilenta TaxID=376489 RepID=A0A172YJE8_9GAMM|nr:formyltetrahydrofolate deformylase [Halotalea alkalilenta]ANF59329.1 formyltetrahydrofolate deformylase [Halotalea alkalilenta]
MKTLVLTLSCADRMGIVAAVGSAIAAQGGNIVESGQYVDRENGRFFMRVCCEVEESGSLEAFRKGFSPVGAEYSMRWEVHDAAVKPRVMIMVSQQGHCLNDLLYRHGTGQLPMELTSILSNHDTFRRRAEHEGVPFHHLPVTAASKAEQEAKLLELIREQRVDLVILARYMQILSDDLSKALSGRVINIHHSFLPSFKGARPYHQAHKRGVKLIGATAHYVTAALDEGPIIEQDVQRVDHSMTAEDMAAIGRDTECQVLARAVRLHLEHRVLLNDDRTVVFH